MKKGFTLVELLAVIIVLSIISLILVPSTFNLIEDIRNATEVERARTLLDLANNYIIEQRLHGTPIREEQIFVIKGKTEYKVDKLGNRVETNYFEQEKEVCDYCVIKINVDKDVYVLYEGKNQDVIKEYNDSTFSSIKLEVPREVKSLYNEFNIFKDIYASNNNITSTKYFKINEQKIYEVDSNGNETEKYSLYNSNGISRITLTNSNSYVMTIIGADGVYKFNSAGEYVKDNSYNTEYSNEILNNYEDIKFSAQNYIKNTTIDSDLYFEFSNGVINKVDKYGNATKDNNMIINPNMKGTGELYINSNSEISIVLYDENKNIKTNYGSEEFYTETINYTREAYTLFKNLDRLELIAKEYSNTLNSKWLVFYYIRTLNDSYNSTMYDIVTGSDTGFVDSVKEKAPMLTSYLESITTYNANGHNIDFKHMAASLAGNIYDSPLASHLAYEELEYDCVVSWAGDLHQLMEDYILKTGVKQTHGNYLNATYNLIGKSNTTFSMEDLYADIDAWNLYYNILENNSLSVKEIFEQYYSAQYHRSYKNRFTSFMGIMDEISSDFKEDKNNFEGVVSHFTDISRGWATIDSLDITPTEAEEKEIADGFIKFIREQALKE